MRKLFILLAIALQVFVLASMAGQREYITRTGKTVYLRTAPIDPRDLFRGDYVRLNYEISSIPMDYLRNGLKTETLEKGHTVYTVLKEGPNGLAELEYASDEKPAEIVFIRGRTSHARRHQPFRGPLSVKYGLEAYFVQQGKGIAIEQRRGRRNDIQIPLEMEIALGSNGQAIIKGHRWSPLGIGLEILESPDRNTQNRQNTRRSAKIKLTLLNASDKPLAIVNLSDFSSFSLEPTAQAQKSWKPTQVSGDFIRPTDADVIVLQPEEKTSYDIDFSDARWWVQADESPTEIGTLPWSESFRLVYRPPAENDCRHLKDKDLIWHGYLPSRAFHGRGRID